jgi:CO/xanthine dehydrogenase FAD-binding subunit
VLAGGQSLGPLLNLRLASPAVLVDVNRVAGLDRIEEEDDELLLGALVRQRVLERDARVRHACPLLAEAAPLIGHVAIRNRGTVGGSIAHADPAAEIPAVVTALGAEVEVVGVRGRRVIAAPDLFVMPLTTAIAPDELLVELRVPAVPRRTGHAWLELAERHGDFALAGVGAVVSLSADGVITATGLGCAGVGPKPFAAREAANLLPGHAPSAELLAEAAERTASACDPTSDAHATAAYRRRLVRVLTERALVAAVAAAKDAHGD